MSFSSWQEFLQMGGYGFYVWAAYGLTLLVLGGAVLAPLLRHRQLLRARARQARRERQQGIRINESRST